MVRHEVRVGGHPHPGRAEPEVKPRALGIRGDDPHRLDGALAALTDAITMGAEPPDHHPLVIDTIRA